MRKLLFIIPAAVISLGASCGNQKPCPPGTVGPFEPYCIPSPSPSPTPEPTAPPTPAPTPTPEPSPEPSPSPTPDPGPSPTPSPSPSASPTPEPSPSAPPEPLPADCSEFKPTNTGLNFLTCTLNNKLICGGGTGKDCICGGQGCAFDVPKNAVCAGDGTPRYEGEWPCWKDCLAAGMDWPCGGIPIQRCEYPPGPSKGHKNEPPKPGFYGWECAGTVKWSAQSGVDLRQEDGYGARVAFPNLGTYTITVCRSDGSHCTSKRARVK